MKILFLDQFSELWGAQRCLLDLLPAVAEHGWHATVALPGKGPLIGRLRAAGAATMDIPCGPYRPGTKSLADIRRFRSDLKPLRPGACGARGYHAIVSCPPALFVAPLRKLS